MKEFILKSKITLIGLLLGIVIGAVNYFNQPSKVANRFVVEYALEAEGNNSSIFAQDTFLIHHYYPIRIYTNSKFDTLQESGIKRSEFIAYSTTPIDSSNYSELLTLHPGTRIVKTVTSYVPKPLNTFLGMSLLGLLLGGLIQRFIVKKKHS